MHYLVSNWFHTGNWVFLFEAFWIKEGSIYISAEPWIVWIPCNVVMWQIYQVSVNRWNAEASSKLLLCITILCYAEKSQLDRTGALLSQKDANAKVANWTYAQLAIFIYGLSSLEPRCLELFLAAQDVLQSATATTSKSGYIESTG